MALHPPDTDLEIDVSNPGAGYLQGFAPRERRVGEDPTHACRGVELLVRCIVGSSRVHNGRVSK